MPIPDSPRLRAHLSPAAPFLVTVVLAAWPAAVRGQSVETFFPSGSFGYDQQLGVTVLSRARPLYEPIGINAGGFIIRPSIDQSVLYNSAVSGSNSPSSWELNTAAGLSAASNWDRNSFAFSLGATHYQYLAVPDLSHTDWNAGLGGTYQIGDGNLALAYSHQSSFQTGTTIGTIRTQTPLLDQTDTAHMNYSFNFGRFSVTPDVSVSAYQFGTATVQGVQLDQNYLDRNALGGSVTTRYSMSDVGSLLVVLQAVNNHFPNRQPGQPSNDSNSFLAAGGGEYQATGPIRYRLLAGVEVRSYNATQYSTTTAPIVQGSVTWSPTGLTTLTGTLTRAVEEPLTAGTSGFVLTSANLVLDHELMRNILLQGRAGGQYAQYLQGGTQTNLTAGGGVTWLLNRNARVSLEYDFVKQSGISQTSATGNLNTLTTGQFDQHLAALTLHLAL